MMIIDPPRPVAYVISRVKALEVKTVFQGVRGTPETIEERSTTRWDLTDRFEEQTWHTYIWVDVRLHVVSKRQFMENTFALRNIVEAPQAAGLFDVP